MRRYTTRLYGKTAPLCAYANNGKARRKAPRRQAAAARSKHTPTRSQRTTTRSQRTTARSKRTATRSQRSTAAGPVGGVPQELR